MRTVFNNHAEVCHVWASRSQSNGRAGNIFFDSSSDGTSTIYSYGRHFPIAEFREAADGSTYVVVNSRSYSVSTSQHQRHVDDALRGNNYPLFTLPNTAWNDAAAAMEWWSGQVAESLGKASRARTRTAEYLDRAAALGAEANRYSALLQLDWPEFSEQPPGIEEARAAAAEYEQQRQELRERREVYHMATKYGIDPAEYDNREDICAAAIGILTTQVAEWFNNERALFPVIPQFARDRSEWLRGFCSRHDGGYDYCRIVDGCIETTRQARVRVDSADGGESVSRSRVALLYGLSRLARERAVAIRLSMRLGYYTAQQIGKDGCLTIGCHRIHHSSIDSIADQLQIPTAAADRSAAAYFDGAAAADGSGSYVLSAS